MVDWQVTAITIYCDAINDEVTIMVYKDWSVKCTGCVDCNEVTGKRASLAKKGNEASKKQTRCLGHECERVIQYREGLRLQERK